MTVRAADKALCDYCEELLGDVSVESIGGHRFHPDCWDKWKKDIAAAELAKNGLLLTVKRGEA